MLVLLDEAGLPGRVYRPSLGPAPGAPARVPPGQRPGRRGLTRGQRRAGPAGPDAGAHAVPARPGPQRAPGARDGDAAGLPRRLRVPVCRDQVRDCSEEFGELIRRLLAAGPVPAQGVAKVGVLLADAGGPLYHRASADDLRAQVRDAADALAAA